jgi:hypothetical protein
MRIRIKKKNFRKNLIASLLFLIILSGSYFFFARAHREFLLITSYEKCVDAGYPILPTYPETCAIPGKSFSNPSQKREKATTTVTPLPKPKTYKDLEYAIEGNLVTLSDGKTTFIDNATKATNTVAYFGNELRTDLNADKLLDIVFLITDTISSDTLYYLVSAYSTTTSLVGSNAVLLGKNITPKQSSLKNGIIVITYNDYHVNKTSYFKFSNGTLEELVR